MGVLSIFGPEQLLKLTPLLRKADSSYSPYQATFRDMMICYVVTLKQFPPVSSSSILQ